MRFSLLERADHVPNYFLRLERLCTLDELHALIQITMGWGFDHLYRFNMSGVEFVGPDMIDDGEIEDATLLRLSDVVPLSNRRPRFTYEYDFGDGWVHQLIVEERFQPT